MLCIYLLVCGKFKFCFLEFSGFFNTSDLQVVESADAEPQIWSTDDKVILGFSTSRRVEFPNPHVIQGSSVILECDLKR